MSAVLLPAALPAKADAPPNGRWRRLLGERSLPLQALLVGLAATGLAGGVVWWLEPWVVLPSTSLTADVASELVVIGGLVATLAMWWLARRVAARLGDLGTSSRGIERAELEGDADFPSQDGNADLHRLAVALQRLLQLGRERIRALQSQNTVLGRQLDARNEQLSTLQDLSLGLATKGSLKELAAEALTALGRTMEYSSASVWTRGGVPGAPVRLLGCRSPEASDAELARLAGARLTRANLGLYEQIERDRTPVVENQARQSVLSWLWTMLTDDATSAALHKQTRSWMALPLQSHHEVVGVLRVDHHEPDYFDAPRSRLLAAVASQTALALRHAELATRERDTAVMAERNRLARELHDAVSQTLFAANMIAGSLTRMADQGGYLNGDDVAKQTRVLERLNRGALAEMRLLMFELRPDALEQTSLADLLTHAVDALSCRGDVVVTTALARGETLPGATRIQIYRLAQEALSNVARHSGARTVTVEWRWEPGVEAVLRVADDGHGFDPGIARPGHFGLGNMQARADEIGAGLSIDTGPDRGTELVLTLPLKP